MYIAFPPVSQTKDVCFEYIAREATVPNTESPLLKIFIVYYYTEISCYRPAMFIANLM